MPYTPNQSKYLTVSQVRTNNGQKDVKIILDVDTNIFYTLDDDNNFIPIAYSQSIDASTVTYDNTTVENAIDELDIYEYNSNNNHSFLDGNAVFSNQSNNVFANNTLICYGIYIKKPITINSLKLVFTTGVSGNSVWGLYNSVNGLPNNLIFQTTEFNNNITGLQQYTLPTGITISAGLYFVSYLTSSIPTIRAISSATCAYVFGDDVGLNGPKTYLTRSLTYSSTLPSIWGTGTFANNTVAIPYVTFGIS